MLFIVFARKWENRPLMDVSYCILIDGMDIQSPLNALFEKNVECNYKILSKFIFIFNLESVKRHFSQQEEFLHLTIINGV